MKVGLRVDPYRQWRLSRGYTTLEPGGFGHFGLKTELGGLLIWALKSD
jgi:hypothetical protein